MSKRDISIAEQLIAANEAQELMERSRGDNAPEGYYTDDMGYWVEQDIKKNRERFAEYILFRCKRKGVYKDRGMLFSGHKEIHPTNTSIIAVADIPYMITSAQATWVYNRLMEIAPEINNDLLYIGRNMAWSASQSDFIDLTDKEFVTTKGSVHNGEGN